MKKKIEIQIRSHEMHEVAENGVAAHWYYKDDSKKARHEEISKMKWLNDLVNILEHAGSSDEFLEHTQMEMYTDQVFCFTPKGALINLPKGRRQSILPMRFILISAISVSAQRSMAGHGSWRPSSIMVIRLRSSPMPRQSRSPNGKTVP